MRSAATGAANARRTRMASFRRPPKWGASQTRHKGVTIIGSSEGRAVVATPQRRALAIAKDLRSVTAKPSVQATTIVRRGVVKASVRTVPWSCQRKGLAAMATTRTAAITQGRYLDDDKASQARAAAKRKSCRGSSADP